MFDSSIIVLFTIGPDCRRLLGIDSFMEILKETVAEDVLYLLRFNFLGSTQQKNDDEKTSRKNLTVFVKIT